MFLKISEFKKAMKSALKTSGGLVIGNVKGHFLVHASLWGEIEDKADGYAKIIMGMKADIEALRTEESRLAARRKALENRQQALKNNLEANMREMGKTKFKTALFSFNIQKNGGLQPLVIDGLLEDIPGRFLIPQPPVPNNEAIRTLLENKAVEWAHLEPRGESLRIR